MKPVRKATSSTNSANSTRGSRSATTLRNWISDDGSLPLSIMERGCIHATDAFFDELVNRNRLSGDLPDADRHVRKGCCQF